MPKALLSLLLFITLQVTGQSIKRIDHSRISEQELNNKILYLMKAARVSGMAVAIYNDQKTVFSNTYGYADVQHKAPLTDSSAMYAASLAKTVFAYIVMQCLEEKLIHLDTPLVAYLNKPLPEYKIPGWNRGYHDLAKDDRYRLITARMCLTHTTGFPNWRWFEPDKKLKFKFDPGTRYSYSGEGLYLLQFVLEQIMQKDYETISKERVFSPFHMKHTSQVWQEAFEKNLSYGHSSDGQPYELMRWKEPSAGGSMTTTLKDYNSFFTGLVSGRGISDSLYQKMTSTQIRIRSQRQFGPLAIVDGPDNDAIQLGYGLGVGVFHTPYGRAFFKEGHDEGWGHYSIYFPEQQVGMLIMTNNDNGESIFKELLSFAIGDIYTPWQWENYIPYK
jgi:CubicO group peptidase (beta-lactamase class C family)